MRWSIIVRVYYCDQEEQLETATALFTISSL